MKKLIALLLVFVMVLTMVACAAKTNAPKTDAPATDESKTEAPAGKIKVGFVTQSLTNASQAYAWTQFQKYAPEYGFEVTLFDEDYDSQNGVAAISTCIAGLHCYLPEPHRPCRAGSRTEGSQGSRYYHWPVFLRSA